MSQVLLLLLALGIGVVAGLRALTPPAVVAWAAYLGWIDLADTWASWLGQPITVGLLSLLALIELVTDQLPKTPSRKTTMQFGTRLITGGFAGAVIGTAFGGIGLIVSAIGAGVIGAVLGTMGGYEARKRLVAANGGRDLPVALAEDVVAIGGGFLLAYLLTFV